MRCPYCQYTKTSVIETRESEETVRRRRKCEACNSRFTTYETARAPGLIVKDGAGARLDFTRAWLASALVLAGTALPGSTLKKVAANVEAELKSRGSPIVTIEDVAAAAIRETGQATSRNGSSHSPTSLPTVEQLAAVLDASFLSLRRASAQLALPIER